MDNAYLSDFKSFRDEFQLVRDEVLRSISDTPSLAAKTVIFENENSQAANLEKINALGDRCSNLLPPHKVSDLLRARKTPNLKPKVIPRQTSKRTETGAKRVTQTHRVINEPLPGSTGLGPRKGHRKSRRGCFNCKQRKVKVFLHHL